MTDRFLTEAAKAALRERAQAILDHRAARSPSIAFDGREELLRDDFGALADPYSTTVNLLDEIEALRGAIAAQDVREQEAGAKCGVPYAEWGCDWPDRMADVVQGLRADRAALRADFERYARHGYDCMKVGPGYRLHNDCTCGLDEARCRWTGSGT